MQTCRHRRSPRGRPDPGPLAGPLTAVLLDGNSEQGRQRGGATGS